MRSPYSWFWSISYFLITTFLSLKPRLRIYINRNNKLQIYLKHRNRACSKKVRSTTLFQNLPLPSFLINIQAKIFNKTVSSRIQDHIRNIIQYNQVAFRTLKKALNKYEALVSPVLQPKCSQYAEYSVVLLLPRNSKSLGTA